MLDRVADIFPTVLNMSIAASVIIAAVLLARLLLRRAPKVFSYALWAVVLFRLLCPVSVSSAVSLLGLLDAPVQENTQYTTAVEYYAPYAAAQPAAPQDVPDPPAVTPNAPGEAPVNAAQDVHGTEPLEIISAVWLCGAAALLLYSAASYIRLRRRLVGYVTLWGNIRIADGISSPFVLGLFRPKIYLPSDLEDREREYIILHEQHHIRRGDHIIKALSFLALCLHWFNPLVWLAFVLSGRDMEMSCDESVLRLFAGDVRGDYAGSLLSLATGRHIISGTPLAFGEGDTKKRIKNLLRWKRPRAWISGLAALLCIVVLAACAVNPAADDSPARGEYGTAEDMAYCFELVSGTGFEDMDAEILQQILDSNPGRIRIEGEVVLARMSADGRSAYVFLLDEGAEDDFTGYEDALIAAGVTLLEPGGSLERDPDGTTTLARVNTSNGTVLLFGEDRPGSMGNFTLYNTYGEYLRGSDRPDYFEDAVSRGICFDTAAAEEVLWVSYTHPEFGGVSESILLTPGQAGEIRSSEREPLALDETEFVAALVVEGETSDLYTADTGIPVSALDMIRAHCPVDSAVAPAQTSSPLAVARGEYGTAGDMAYYFELVNGGEFHDMDAARRDELLAEYGDLLDGYSFIARENEDGAGYIVGQYDGDPAESALGGMRVAELGVAGFVLYPSSEHERVVDDAVAGRVPSGVLAPKNSTIDWYLNAAIVCIWPQGTAEFYGTLNRYLYWQNGREYIADALSRGIDLSPNTDGPYLIVYLISEEFGEINERIPLTDAEAEAMLAEEREPVEGFMASLWYNGESTTFSDLDGSGAPRSAIDLAVERCGYKFGSPADITGDIVEARLDGFGEPIYAAEEDLPRLRSLLLNAEKSSMGACGYGAKLTLTLSNGEQVVAYKGTDNCDTIAFGSYNGYVLGGAAANDEFWSIFGMGATGSSEEITLDDGTRVTVAARSPAMIEFLGEGVNAYADGYLAGLDESYDLAYSGGYTGTFGVSGAFLALRGMLAAGSAPVSLFVSTDGGRSWRTMGDPHRQGVYHGVITGAGFYDADTAFLCYRYYEYVGPTVYCTYDGGKSWSRLNAEIPAQYVSDRGRWVFTPSSPEFDGTNGVIPVEVLDQDTSETTQLRLVTHDAGRTWDWEN